MLDSFLKFLGLETKEKNPAPKNWTWQKPKEKESTRIFLKIKNSSNITNLKTISNSFSYIIV